MELEDLHSCDHCGVKAGKKRPVGKYIVELYPFEDGEELKLLCISCYKQSMKEARERALKEGKANLDNGLFNELIKMYQSIFPKKEKASS